MEGTRWPEDFATRDQGRLWVRRDFEAAFDALGWRTVADVMTCPRPTLIRALSDRANLIVDLPSPRDPSSTIRLHLKRHIGQRTHRRPAFAHSPVRSDVAAGVHEADAVGACQRAGVPVMSVVAAGQRLTGGRRADSFFISEDLHDALPAEAYWARHMTTADPASREALLAALAQAAAKLHRAGLFHRDLYWCHFMVGAGGGRGDLGKSPHTIHFIDLQRLHRPLVPAYARMKDLAQFIVSTPRPPEIPVGGPTPGELRSWFARYLDVPALSWPQRVAFAAVRIRAAFYRIKGLKA